MLYFLQVEEQLTPDIDVNFQYGEVSALQIAVDLGYADICRILIDRDANVSKSDAKYDRFEYQSVNLYL